MTQAKNIEQEGHRDKLQAFLSELEKYEASFSSSGEDPFIGTNFTK